MVETASYQPGQRVQHRDYGDGVIVSPERDGFISVFFGANERQVPVDSISAHVSRTEKILAHVDGTQDHLNSIWLSYEAHALPLMESAAALTAAPIDLLPHQVVLTHRIATAMPRRYLVADEVGLGKTIETALVLRELASRGELRRALMVVPAGLVNNWHRELNEVFHLDFEVFGSEGDITDRRSNAFARHDRLIASIDTLKRQSRIERLKEAPPWDLVVFDEAHHLTAARSGKKIRKTENYKLAEVLKEHTRDLLLLSATPHQGDHFRFWMLIQLLNPTLFKGPAEMTDSRHRLNAVVVRRTKADACKPDGSPLFARRVVHTESFTMSDVERTFYGDLRDYLQDGFAMAQRQGSQGQALGFVMAIFQKIAASSFAAVKRTLRRRLLMLTLHEGILKEEDLDLDGRQRLLDESRELIHEEYSLPDDAVGNGQADKMLADLKLKLLKRLNEQALSTAANAGSGEAAAASGEDLAAMTVGVALPEERSRIRQLLKDFPAGRETKADKLLRGLGALWRQNPAEKVVVFATYLGTVDLIGREIEISYPDKGVVVLRGGDHGAKLAAEKRFKNPQGPKVLICTAAGREGINLQNARVLFNFDLPWNPMDVEQRIGRIHRYGQLHTAQIYNLVLSDTIEGRIFLLLNDKLLEIARALGKVDDRGNVAEDLRSQILGQLSEKLTYDKLYRDALSDPELKRTRQEVEAALSNASEARKVVFELFQDLDGFSLDDYKPFENISAGIQRIVEFMQQSLRLEGWKIERTDEFHYRLQAPYKGPEKILTTDRDEARDDDTMDLIGLDHPLVQQQILRCKDTPAEQLGVAVKGELSQPTVLSLWLLETQEERGSYKAHVQALAVNLDGQRQAVIENQIEKVFQMAPSNPILTMSQRNDLLKTHIAPMVQRHVQHNNHADGHGGFASKLIGWIEIGN